MAPVLRNAVQQLHVASLRSKLLAGPCITTRGYAEKKAGFAGKERGYDDAGNNEEGYASKEAFADSQTIPKPKKGSPADVQDRPPPPEAKPVIEPGMDPNAWDPNDPKFQRMTKQLVWAIKTRPSADADGPASIHEPTKPMPSDRHTDARSGNVYEEDVKVGSGRLNILHLKEIYLKRWEALSQGKTLGVKELSEHYKIDPGLLEKVLKYTELPVVRPDRRGRDVGISQQEALELQREQASEL